MSLYSAEDEDRIRVDRLVREWTRSGLLDAAQETALRADLRVDLRRTNAFLRAGLALFTTLIIAASVGLIITLLDASTAIALGLIAGSAALVCIGLAEYAVRQFRCYRLGIEEALAVASAVLLGISGGEITSWLDTGIPGMPAVVGLLIGAAGGVGLYRRFGFVYAALGCIVCVGALPFQLNLPSTIQRVLAAAAITFVFIVARSKRLTHGADYPGDGYAWWQAAAWAGLYLTLNLQLSGGEHTTDRLFYWCTCGATWLIPLIGLRLGIRDKDRELMDVSVLLALVTAVTTKPYLGWPRNTWDPVVLGMVVIAIAIAARRWLAAGRHGERHGFTAARLLDQDRAVLSRLGTASVIIPSPAPGALPPHAEPAPDFSGGRSGGGGGDASF